MPKKIDPAVRQRVMRMIAEHRLEYATPTELARVIAARERLGVETVRRWVVQAEVDGGDPSRRQQHRACRDQSVEGPGAPARRRQCDLEGGDGFLRGGTRPPQPLIMGFIDAMRAEGHAVESTCRVLREQGCRVAARTYRAWRTRRPAARTISDAQVVHAIRDIAWTIKPDGRRQLTPEGLYGRRKMTAQLRRTTMPSVSAGAVDRAMRVLGLVGVRRGKGMRTTIPAKDGTRAQDLLDRDFTADAPNRVWVTDFTYVRSWAGFCYVAFIVDVLAQKIVAWHATTSKTTELLMTPLRMALWQRGREGRPAQPGELIHHSDAGSQYTSIRFSEHLALEGIRPSIGSVGDAFDNALMETIIGLFKTECIRTTVFHNWPYKTLADVAYATPGCLDWYNNRSLHER